MGDNSVHLLGAILLQRRGRLVQRAARICHVVDQDGDLTLDVADERHTPDDVGARPFLVNQGEARVEAVSKRSSTLSAAGIWGHDDRVGDVEVVADPPKDGGLGVEIVDRDVEEALDLGCVQVDGDDMILEPG
jgi:hypothetical protein